MSGWRQNWTVKREKSVYELGRHYIFSELVERYDVVFDTSILDIQYGDPAQKSAHREDLVLSLEKGMAVTDDAVASEMWGINALYNDKTLTGLVKSSIRAYPVDFDEAYEYIHHMAIQHGVAGNKFSDRTDVKIATRAYLLGKYFPVLATADHKLCDMILGINKQVKDWIAPECINPPRRLVEPWCMHKRVGIFIPWYGKKDYTKRVSHLKDKGIISPPE